MNRHLVIVIPGIGGSVLSDEIDPATRSILWDARPGSIIRALKNPDALRVDEVGSLVPIGLVPDTGVIPGFSIIHGYSRVIKRLRDVPGVRLDLGDPAHPDLDANVVLFPYDFRRGVVEAAERLSVEIDRRLAHLGLPGAGPHVVLVGHSMGGLVARYYAGPLGGWPRVRTLLSLGTPHRGAPRAVDVALNGIGLGPFRATSLSSTLATWPGLADLYPSYAGVLDAHSGERRYLADLPLHVAAEAARSRQLHRDIDSSWLQVPRSGPQVLVKFGWSHRTPSDMVFRGDGVEVSKQSSQLAEIGRWANAWGDGTVPAVSAVPIEMSNATPTGMHSRRRHGPLAAHRTLFSLVREVDAYANLAPIREAQTPLPTLGLDIPECTFAEFGICATVHGLNAAEDGVRLWYRVMAAGREIASGELDHEGGEYIGSVEPRCEAEVLDVTVTATGLPGNRQLIVEDSIAVFRS